MAEVRTRGVQRVNRGSRRSRLWSTLDQPMLSEGTKVGLDLAFGLYRRRIDLLRRWGVLDGGASVLDVGCGIGQYSALTSGEYLGIDLNERYIEYARRLRGRPGRAFRCIDVHDLREEGGEFDVVLMVDFLHHLGDQLCRDLLENAGQIANRAVVSFEPITGQRNPLGRWIVDNDRGDHMRELEDLRAVFDAVASLSVQESLELQLGPITTQALPCAPSRPVGSQTI